MDPVTVNWTIIGDAKELNIHGSHLGPYCYQPVLERMANGREIAGKGDDSIKVVLVP